MESEVKFLQALRASFPFTVPILAGFLFLGFAYGMYMQSLGFSFVYPMVMSAIIFAGSIEFVAASMLVASFQPLQALFLTLILNARHLFYGISMLEKYRGTGKKKPYLIFGLCDETFSINYGARIPLGVDKTWFYFCVTLLNQLYWIVGATMGGLIGSYVSFNTRGLDFAMVAMFVVIFMENWKREDNHLASLAGIFITGLFRIVFGREVFIIPSMIGIIFALLLMKKGLEGRYRSKKKEEDKIYESL